MTSQGYTLLVHDIHRGLQQYVEMTARGRGSDFVTADNNNSIHS